MSRDFASVVTNAANGATLSCRYRRPETRDGWGPPMKAIEPKLALKTFALFIKALTHKKSIPNPAGDQNIAALSLAAVAAMEGVDRKRPRDGTDAIVQEALQEEIRKKEAKKRAKAGRECRIVSIRGYKAIRVDGLEAAWAPDGRRLTVALTPVLFPWLGPQAQASRNGGG